MPMLQAELPQGAAQEVATVQPFYVALGDIATLHAIFEVAEQAHTAYVGSLDEAGQAAVRSADTYLASPLAKAIGVNAMFLSDERRADYKQLLRPHQEAIQASNEAWSQVDIQGAWVAAVVHQQIMESFLASKEEPAVPAKAASTSAKSTTTKPSGRQSLADLFWQAWKKATQPRVSGGKSQNAPRIGLAL